ncbi:hypothetical protein [Vibrio splendidus]|uniref:Transposase n=1 Tax=Vibrio splendidus TaxID=29497 RepID=A0ABD5A7E9_VIBSP|nr:hypothetical protein [Vibrio splendidus]MDP2488236.1 hypothetical protein [Vibrio splendidus]
MMEIKNTAQKGKHRVWGELYLAIDTNTREIIPDDSNLSNVTNGETLLG